MSKMSPYVSVGVLAAAVLGAAPATADDIPSAAPSGAAAAEWQPMRIRFQGNTDYCLGVDAIGQPEIGDELKVLPCLYEHAYVDLAYNAKSGRLRLAANTNLCLGAPGSSTDAHRLVTTSCGAADAAAVDFKFDAVALRGAEPACVDKQAAARPCKQQDADQKWKVVPVTGTEHG